MRRLGLTFALLAVAAASPLSAQVRTTSLGISGGLSMPTGDALDAAEMGYNITGSLYIRPARFANLGFRGDIAWDKFSVENSDGSTIRSLGFVFNGQYSLPVGSSVTPYLLAGIGWYSTEVIAVAGSVERKGSDSNLGYDVGAGLAFNLSGFSTFLEARYVNIMADPNSYSFAPITFGIRF